MSCAALVLGLVLATGCDDEAKTPTDGNGADAPAGVAVGALAPDVTMALHDGSSVKLRDLKGNKVLVYFYPKDDTPG